ncbi:MAG: hypothetical protein MJK12_17395 [Colwellia sp.]|nr:hypothetical protein [Colwellia sp.]
MKKFTISVITSISILTIGVFMPLDASADTLTLKDGQTLNGTLVSRDANNLVFDIAGQQLTFPSDKVKSISFGDEVIAPQANAGQEKVNQEVAQAPVSVPAGTVVMIKMSTSIDSKKHNTGHRFTARLEADLIAGNVVVAPRGSTIYGVVSEAKQSGRATGSSSLELTFTDIMINNQMKPILTSGVKAVTESTGKATVGRTARLAAVGGLANGSKGAKNAAKVGVGVSLLTSGNSINIPAGTLLEFQLAAPLAS